MSRRVHSFISVLIAALLALAMFLPMPVIAQEEQVPANECQLQVPWGLLSICSPAGRSLGEPDTLLVVLHNPNPESVSFRIQIAYTGNGLVFELPDVHRGYLTDCEQTPAYCTIWIAELSSGQMAYYHSTFRASQPGFVTLALRGEADFDGAGFKPMQPYQFIWGHFYRG